MRKILRWLAFFCASLLTFLVLGILILTWVIDPHDLQEELTKQIYRHTHREFAIHGKVSWLRFPHLGIRAYNLTLSNAPGYASPHMATIESMACSIKWLPLLRGELVIDSASLDGLVLHLQVDNEGHTNWDDLRKTADQDTDISSLSPNMALQLFQPDHMRLAHLRISHAALYYQNGQSHSDFAFTDIHAAADDLRLHTSFPVTLSTKLKTPTAEGMLTISGDTFIDLEKDRALVNNFDTKIRMQPNHSPVQHLSLHGNLEIQPNVPAILVPKLEGIWMDNPFSGSLAFSYAKGYPDISGDLHMDNATVGGAHVTHFDARIQSFDHQTLIKPIVLSLYNGQVQADVTISHQPQQNFSANLSAKDIPIGALTKDLGLPVAVKALLSAQGHWSGTRQVLCGDFPCLAGQLETTLGKGEIEGVDFAQWHQYILSFTQNALQAKPADTNPNGHTVFQQAKATWLFEGMQWRNDNLKITGADYVATGKGTLKIAQPFSNSLLDYGLALQYPEINYPLAVRLSGPIGKPKVTPDFTQLLEAFLKSQIQRQLTNF
ncbi:MAG: AsmA family protein, partial [Pseudomonadota bacterium]